MSKQESFIKTLLDASESKDLKTAVNEWCISNLVEPSNDINQCICTNTNNVYYQCYNKFNKNTLYIGFDCITKHCPLLKNDAVILNKQHHYKKTSKNPNKRLCHHCHKHNINQDQEAWVTICKSCWTSGIKTVDPISILGYRLCEGCFMLTIPPNKPESVNKCHHCYKPEMKIYKKDELRACVECNELKIPLTSPHYIDKCSTCYRLHKENLKNVEMRACQMCNELKVPSNLPDYRTLCSDCYKHKVANEVMRECMTCHQMKIKESEPDFKNQCVSCFKQSKIKQSKEINMDQIKTANAKNINLLTQMMNNKNKT
jgi:hypothetical protein